MKKFISFMLVLILCMCSCVSTFSADQMTEDEYAAVEYALRITETWGDNFEISYLLDASGIQSYLLGTTEKGYIILERGSYKLLQGGEGNPYHRFMSEEKYYGGPLCYFVRIKEKDITQSIYGPYFDIVHNQCVSEVVELNRNAVNSICEEKQLYATNSTTYKRVSNYFSYIRKRAFGWNTTGDYNNTCSAVALGQALNYLTLQYGNSYVPTNWQSELRTVQQEGINSYPKAAALHHYLVDTCNLHPISYGSIVVTGFNTYKANMIPSSYSISLTSTVSPAVNTIKSKINNNLPVLITTTIGNPENPEYNWHTMLVYGYRIIDGETKYLIHNGWYGVNSGYSTYSNGVHTQIEEWYDPTYATIGYYFTIN